MKTMTMVSHCCTACKVDFQLPIGATDFNEYDIYCPLCGKVENTFLYSLEWNKSVGRS